MANRDRSVTLHFWVTPEEKELIQSKMQQAGVKNMSAFLRKIAIDGYVVRLDVPELQEMLTNVRRAGGNLSQLTKRVNETGRFYEADMEDLRQTYGKLQTAAEAILEKLSTLLNH